MSVSHQYARGDRIMGKYIVRKTFAPGTPNMSLEATAVDDRRQTIVYIMKFIRRQIAEIDTEHREEVKWMKGNTGIMRISRYISCQVVGSEIAYIFEVGKLSLADVQALNTRIRFTRQDIKTIIAQLIRAVSFLHLQGFPHGHISPNCIYLDDIRTFSKRVYNCAEDVYEQYDELMDVGIQVVFTGDTVHRGSPSGPEGGGYQAPELLLDSCSVREENDNFAIGVIAAELYLRRRLFKSVDAELDESISLHLKMMEAVFGPFPQEMIMVIEALSDGIYFNEEDEKNQSAELRATAVVYAASGCSKVVQVLRKVTKENIIEAPEDLELGNYFPEGAFSVRVAGVGSLRSRVAPAFRFYMSNHTVLLPVNESIKLELGLPWLGSLVVAKYQDKGFNDSPFLNIKSVELPYIDVLVQQWISTQISEGLYSLQLHA
ncbi:kinase-like domain-containing protein [Ephemerocybe angulata]|uniref:Kinase-like domain-containing protein n=1 Tax=Ephemerocybe angulata TaxID=980116 RepID=A0A8H6HDQ1_9AGAR|nr:kinase-like domain-containing protein [Tulosesus angulatus]